MQTSLLGVVRHLHICRSEYSAGHELTRVCLLTQDAIRKVVSILCTFIDKSLKQFVWVAAAVFSRPAQPLDLQYFEPLPLSLSLVASVATGIIANVD